MQLIRRLAALAGGVLVSVGLRLEAVAEPAPDLADVDSCARCRGRYVLTGAQLATATRNAARGVPLSVIALEANAMYWVPAE